MGLQARVNAIICRKIYDAIAKSKTVMIFINQLREKIGIAYGNPYTTGGGRALKHMYNTRLEFRVGSPIDIGSGTTKERIGAEINIKCIKNKKGVPYRSAIVPFYFTGELDNKSAILFAGIKFGIIEQKGPFYAYEEIKEKGQIEFCNKITDKQWKAVEKEVWKRMGK
jgi:recombination protein RecA